MLASGARSPAPPRDAGPGPLGGEVARAGLCRGPISPIPEGGPRADPVRPPAGRRAQLAGRGRGGGGPSVTGPMVQPARRDPPGQRRQADRQCGPTPYAYGLFLPHGPAKAFGGVAARGAGATTGAARPGPAMAGASPGVTPVITIVRYA